MDDYYTVDAKETLEPGLWVHSYKSIECLPAQISKRVEPDISRYAVELLTSGNNEETRHLQISELLFEQIRQDHYRSKPSRLNCLFAFQRLNEAQHFLNHYRPPQSRIYQVSAVGEVHLGYFPLINATSSPAAILELAHLYWQGKKSDIAYQYREVLLPLPVKIEMLVSE